jgi:signal transduction histidine kinase
MVAALCTVAYLAMARSLDREVDAGIQSVVETWVASAPPLERLRSTDVEREFEGQTAGVFLLVFGADGSLLANPNRLHVDDLFEHGRLAEAIHRGGWATLDAEGQPLRVLVLPVPSEGRQTGVVVGGRSLADHDQQQQALVWVLLGSGGIGLAVAIAGGYLLAGRALRPLELAYERQRAFIGDASHELRSPIAVIRMSADLLLRADLTADQRATVEEIRDVADEATALIQDLLALARLEAPAARNDERARLDKAATAVIEQLGPLLEAHHLDISTRLEPAPACLDDAQARRLVRALVENVAMHTPDGTAVEVETGTRGDRAFLAIRDRGPGVPEAAIEQVFERFSQVEEARTPGKQHGSGLGLAIVRAIAVAAGGTARARNRVGGGFEVEVLLPLAAE